MKFSIVLSDPPWKYINSDGKRGRAEHHYDTESVTLMSRWDVSSIMEDDSVMLMWTTWPFLVNGECSALLDAWELRGVTGFPWLKLSKDMIPRMGTGFHRRGVSEPVVIAVKGKPRCPLPGDRGPGVLFNKQGPHSAKPDLIYEACEAYGPGPYLEIFARPDGGLDEHRANWIKIGNEMTGRPLEEDIALLQKCESIEQWNEWNNIK